LIAFARIGVFAHTDDADPSVTNPLGTRPWTTRGGATLSSVTSGPKLGIVISPVGASVDGSAADRSSTSSASARAFASASAVSGSSTGGTESVSPSGSQPKDGELSSLDSNRLASRSPVAGVSGSGSMSGATRVSGISAVRFRGTGDFDADHDPVTSSFWASHGFVRLSLPADTQPPIDGAVEESSVPDSRCQRGANGKLAATSGDFPLRPMETVRAMKVRPKRCFADRLAPFERVLVLRAEERAGGVEEPTARRHPLVRFHGARVHALLGGPDELLRDPWFGRDAIRTAATWAGIADAARAAALEALGPRALAGDDLAALAVGRIDTHAQTIDLWLAEAGRRADAHPEAAMRTLSVHLREAVARAAQALVDEALRAAGSRPLARGGALDRAARDLRIFLLQHRLDPLLVRAGREAVDR